MTKYVLGNGKTSITKGTIKELEIPYLVFENLEGQFKIGEDILKNENAQKENPTMIIIKNLDGLAVLKLLIKQVEKQLKQQNSIK